MLKKGDYEKLHRTIARENYLGLERKDDIVVWPNGRIFCFISLRAPLLVVGVDCRIEVRKGKRDCSLEIL
jgi:hypothetical protein